MSLLDPLILRELDFLGQSWRVKNLPYISVSDIRTEWLVIVRAEGLSLCRAPCRTYNAVESNNASLAREAKSRGPVRELMSEFRSEFSVGSPTSLNLPM